MAEESEKTLYPIRRNRTSSVSRCLILQSFPLLLAQLRIADPAVMPSVGEIDDQSDNQPDDQARPVDPAQFVHHVAVENDPEHRHQRHQWRPEGAWLIGVGVAK